MQKDSCGNFGTAKTKEYPAQLCTAIASTVAMFFHDKFSHVTSVVQHEQEYVQVLEQAFVPLDLYLQTTMGADYAHFTRT